MADTDVTINAVVICSSDDLSTWEPGLDDTTEDVTDNAPSVQRFIQRRLAQDGIAEDELSAAIELREFAGYEWLYQYYRGESSAVDSEGFNAKAEQYKEARDEQIALLFGPPITLTLVSAAVTTEVPKLFRLLQIG